MTRTPALEVLAKDEAEAWADYLATIRGQPSVRYEELEPWAWNRLNQKLLAIQGRRRALEDDGA